MSSLRTVAPQQKYGLIKKGTGGGIKRTAISAFTNDDNDEENTTFGTSSFSDINRVNKQIITSKAIFAKEVEKIHNTAMTEDPLIFDYDGSYDDMKKDKIMSHPLSQSFSKDPPKSKYVSNLKTAAVLRERENDKAYERKLLKERKEEEEQFGEEEQKFVTSAYREKLEERQKWEYEERIQSAMDKKNDVRVKGMQSFYSNLLTKNVAVGGDVNTSAVSAFTAGSQRQQGLLHSVEKETKTTAEEGGRSNAYTGSSSSSSAAVILESVNEDTNIIISVQVHDEPVSIRPSAVSESSTTERETEINKTEEIIKVDKVMSARERFLARKTGTKVE